MLIHNRFLISSFTALSLISACQSDNTGQAPASAGSAGAGGSGAMGGRAGQGSAGESPLAGAAGKGGTAQAGSGGIAGGGFSGGGGSQSAGSGGTNTGGASGGSAGTAGSSGGAAGSSGGEAGGAGSSGQDAREFAYFSGLFDGVTVCQLELGHAQTAGTPRVIQKVTSKHAIALTTDPTQQFLYVATDDAHIDTYRIATDGTLPTSPTSSVDTPGGLVAITIDPKGRFLYADGAAIYGYTIDAATGALSAIAGTPPTGGSYVAADPTGNFVYVSGQGLNGYRVDQSSGALNPLPGSPFGTTDLPDGDVVGGAVVFKPSGDFLYTSGMQGNGALNAFAIEPGTGKLSLVAGSPFSRDLDSDFNASDIAMDPEGQYVYVTSFRTSHVSGFKIQADGSLVAVPGPPKQALSPYALGVDPSGRFVYIASDSGNNAVYALSRSDGSLGEITNSPFFFGALQPEVSFATLP